jgi:hypothetical protein
MSGPNPGWNPDGTPADDTDANDSADTPQQPPDGQPPFGQPPYGSPPQEPPSQPPYGNVPQASYGDAPHQPTYGQSYGSTPQASYGDAPQQQPTYGDAPQQPVYPSPGQDYSSGQPGYAAPPPPPAYPAPDPAQYGDPSQPPYLPATPPPAKRRPWVGIVLLLIVVVGVGGFFLFRDRLSGSASDLSVGECIDEPAGTSDITDVQHQPCNEPHDGEVFAILNHTAAPGAAYPPTSEFQDLVSDECLPALEEYTARTYDEVYAAGLDVSFLYPSSSSWSDNDREVSCFIVKTDESKMTGSVRAGGSSPLP